MPLVSMNEFLPKAKANKFASKYLTPANNAMKAVIQEKIRLFGSNNQA